MVATIVRSKLNLGHSSWMVSCGLTLMMLTGCAGLDRHLVHSDADPSSDPDPTTGVVSVVDELQRQALTRQADGQYAEAASLLERALRIEGQNAELYQQLAEVRLSQGRFAEAEQLALRGLSIARRHREQATLWHVVAQARSGLGDAAGAREARRQRCELTDC